MKPLKFVPPWAAGISILLIGIFTFYCMLIWFVGLSGVGPNTYFLIVFLLLILGLLYFTSFVPCAVLFNYLKETKEKNK